MKKHSVIGGVLLILLGLFFLFQQLDLPYLKQIATWQLILIGIGIYFIITSLIDGKRDGAIFPGVILLGLGIHFLGQDLVADWPKHWAIYTLIVAIAFFAQALFFRHKASLLPGVILLGVTLFSTILNDYWREIPWPYIWPALLILVGIVLLFRIRK